MFNEEEQKFENAKMRAGGYQLTLRAIVAIIGAPIMFKFMELTKAQIDAIKVDAIYRIANASLGDIE